MAQTFTGKNFFGEPIFAVRGSRGSIIFYERSPEETDDADSDAKTISLNAESAKSLSVWINETAPEQP